MKSGSFDSYRAALSGSGADIGGERDDAASEPTFQQAQQAELDHAYRKHGRDPWSRHEFWGVLDEEVTELKAAIMSDAPMSDVLKEAMQIACVCQRYAETGDRYRGQHPPISAFARIAKAEGGCQ